MGEIFKGILMDILMLYEFPHRGVGGKYNNGKKI
jgi:hypothetical protein